MPDLRTEIFTKVLPTLRQNMNPPQPSKETTMDSLDDLKFDDDTETTEVAVTQVSKLDTTKNLTHMIVDYYVRNLSADVGTCAAALGLERGDVSTRVAQLMKRGYIVSTSERSATGSTVYQWAGKPYKVLSKSEVAKLGRATRVRRKLQRDILARARAAKAAKATKRGKAAPVKAEATEAKVQVAAAPITGRINVDDLPLAVARDLYEQLRKVFGG